jgi:hypothetical protein
MRAYVLACDSDGRYTIASYDESVGQAQIYNTNGVVIGDPDLKNAFRSCDKCFLAPGSKYLFYTAVQGGWEYVAPLLHHLLPATSSCEQCGSTPLPHETKRDEWL